MKHQGMLEHQFYISRLIHRHLSGDLNLLEEQELRAWLDASAENRKLFITFGHEDQVSERIKDFHDVDSERLWGQVADLLDFNRPVVKQSKFWLRFIPAAASILLISGIALYFYINNHKKQVSGVEYTHDIKPGGNKAILTLSNGQQIVLNDARNGHLAQEADATIRKTANGSLIYQEVGGESDKVVTNTISTPRGGQYTLTLVDGTVVTLNAASSLSYPTSFNGSERKVKLSGEAYFQVAHNNSKPFRIISAGQEVEVLGTHFDINAYSDEPQIKTVLIQGAVRINRKTILKPGQMAVNSGDSIRVLQADIEQATDWKNGFFKFENEPLESIMRKISRWYNVEVVFADPKLKNAVIWGKMSRSENVSIVLHKLHLTGEASFKIEDRKVTVTNMISN